MKRLCLALLLVLSCSYAQAELQPLLRGSYPKIISTHAGRPFVVALWSVSCTHCAADMDIFARLLKQYPKFKLVLISTDSPEIEAAITHRLQQYQLLDAIQRKGGNVESWVFADSYTERLHFEVDAQWYGELPRTYFFDANGKATALSGVLDAAQTERWVRAIP